jgi:hypothetical protein
MPFNRGNLGRTPFLWFANVYIEYTLKLGRNALSINLNVDNIFDADTSIWVFDYRTLEEVLVTEDQLLAKDWDLETVGYAPNPQFNMNFRFYPPISARLGVRFSF